MTDTNVVFKNIILIQHGKNNEGTRYPTGSLMVLSLRAR